MPLPSSLIRMLITGLRAARPDSALAGLWSGRLELGLELAIPEDSPEDRWGLDAHALRLLKLAPRARTPEILLDLASAGDSLRRLESFRAMDTLACLGLLRLAEGHVATPQLRQPPAPFGSRPAAPPPAVDLRGSRPVPPAPPEEPAPASRPPGTPPRANRSIPPPAAEQDPAIKKLFDALEAVKQAHPVEILELTDKKRVTEEDISAAFRDVSRRSHPDRFPEQPAKGMAEELFGKINAAYELLKTPGGMSDANRFLQARVSGQPYVPEKDHLSARVAFRKAEMLVRNRDWPGAAPLLEEAFRLDPATWPHALYWHQARYYTRRSPGMPVIHDLEALLKVMEPGPAPENLWDKEKGPAPSVVMRFQRFAEAAAALGNILKLEGKAAESLTAYKRALAADPENRDAQRELRLTELRAGAAPEKDWLGKLFRR
jgi:tetratricopeptide (TPR) repeat protein